MKLALRRIFVFIFLGLIPIIICGCGQPIGYKEVESQFRYYHSTSPEWLPSAAGPGASVFRRLENVNRSKFKVFGVIAKDDRYVWYAGIPIIGADAESFLNLEGPYQKDKLAVYVNGVFLHDVKSNAFEVIRVNSQNEDMAYARTDEEVYYMDRPLNVSSVKSFNFIPGFDFWARDGINYFYFENKITVGIYDELEIINNGWFKDKQFVFSAYGETLIINKENDSDTPSLDINTIEKTEHYSYLKDKYGYIDVYSKRRVSSDDYKLQLKHLD